MTPTKMLAAFALLLTMGLLTTNLNAQSFKDSADCQISATMTVTQACSRVATPENVDWFRKLLKLNPGAFVQIDGQAICVTAPTGGCLTLPDPADCPKPDDVILL